jgi:hypothetical protein
MLSCFEFNLTLYNLKKFSFAKLTEGRIGGLDSSFSGTSEANSFYRCMLAIWSHILSSTSSHGSASYMIFNSIVSIV